MSKEEDTPNFEEFWDEDAEFLGEEEKSEEEQPKDEEPKKAEEPDFSEEDETPQEDESISPTKQFIQSLAQVGFLEETDEEVDIETAIEAIILKEEEHIAAAVESVFESWKEKIGEKGAEFVKFTNSGGDPEEFFKMYANEALQFDVNTERGQEAFLTWYYKRNEEMDDDDIEDRLLSLRDKGTMDSKAKSLYSKMREKHDKEAQKKVQQQIEANKKAQEQFRKEQEQLYNKLAKVDKIGEEPLSKMERTTLVNFIMRNSETYEGERITPLAKALNEIYDKPDKLLLLAKWAKAGFSESFLKKESSAAKKQQKRDFKPEPKKKSVLDYF
jgi:hypothetical protein